jgi:hypothetical protein
MPSPETVTVWANGYGRWHARITFPAAYGPAELAAARVRVRRKARRRIRQAITLRGECGPGWPCRVVLRDCARDDDGRTHSVTYAER